MDWSAQEGKRGGEVRYAINEEIKFAMAIEQAAYRARRYFGAKFLLGMAKSLDFKPHLTAAKSHDDLYVRTPLPTASWVKGGK